MLKALLKHKEFVLLCLILLVGLFLRVYKLPQMVGFDADQEYAAQFAQTVLKVYPIQMIGQGLSVPGLFMGPWYFYYLVPFFALTNLHPLGGYIGSIILGLVTAASYYFFLKPVFGSKTALLGAFLRSILFTRLQYDWTMAPSYSSELAILTTWFCLYNYWKGRMQYLPLLAFVMGLYTSFHPILFPFFGVLVLFLMIKRKLPNLSIIALSLILFVIPIFPLLRFEYYRHFLEVQTLFSLHKSSTSEIKTVQTFFSYILILFRFPTTVLSLHFSDAINTIINAFTYIFLLGFLLREQDFLKQKFHSVIFFSSTILFLLYYFFLPTHVPEYYFLGVEILFFIYLCSLLGFVLETKRAWITMLLLIGITAANFIPLWQRWTHPQFVSLADKDYVLSVISQKQKTDPHYNFFTTFDPGQQFGMGYLERYYGLTGGQTPTVTYEIVIPASLSKEKPTFTSASGNIAVIEHPL